MRLDGRKSLTLGDAKKMTPTVNLMNPKWRQTFQEALQKLGGQFSATDVRPTPEADEAIDAQEQLDNTRLGVSRPKRSKTIRSFPEGAAYVNRYRQSLDRVGVDAGPEPLALPDTEAGVVGAGSGDLIGNALALALRAHPFSAGLANHAAPFVGAIAPQLKNHVARVGSGADAPELRASALTARAEAARLRGEGASSPELGAYYAQAPDVLAGHRNAPGPMSATEVNAWSNPGLGWSAHLGRASRWFPGIGAGIGAVGRGYAKVKETQEQNAEITRLNQTRPADQQIPLVETPTAEVAGSAAEGAALPAAAWAAARRFKNPLAGGAAGMLAANAVSGAGELVRASMDPTVVDDARRAEIGKRPGAGTVAFRTLMGDPIGAAAAVEPAARRSAEREAFLARRDTVPLQNGGFLPRDRDKIHRRVGESLQAAPSVPNAALTQLVQAQMGTGAAIHFMASDAPKSDIAKRARTMARAFADQNGIAWEDPRVQRYQDILARAWGDKPAYKISDADAKLEALDMGKQIAGAWRIPLTQRAVNEMSKLVQVLGPETARAALLPSKDLSDPQDELRLQAVLNAGWVPKAIYDKGADIYQDRVRMLANPSQPQPSAPTSATTPSQPLGAGAAPKPDYNAVNTREAQA